MVSHIHSLRLQKIFRPANSHPTVLCFGFPRSRFASVHLDAGSYQRLHTSILLIVFYFLEPITPGRLLLLPPPPLV